jgi:signal-transduction protein with cAMP-binding, CBS, and nucleotidyltransferase domain
LKHDGHQFLKPEDLSYSAHGSEVKVMEIKRAIQQLEIFKSINPESFQNLIENAQIQFLNSREVLVDEKAPVQSIYFVLHGALKMQMRNHIGDDIIYHFLNRGDSIGVHLHDQSYGGQFVAMEDSAVLKIPKNVFDSLKAHEATVTAHLNEELTSRLAELQHEKYLTRGHIPQKVADLFLSLLDRQGPLAGSRILMKLSLNDVARKIGAEPESVIRHMTQWKKNHWIQIENKHIEILDRQALEELRTPETAQNELSLAHLG